jgi:hypothetical protein
MGVRRLREDVQFLAALATIAAVAVAGTSWLAARPASVLLTIFGAIGTLAGLCVIAAVLIPRSLARYRSDE